MQTARDRLDWRWLDTVNLTPTIITRLVYQFYLALPIALVDSLIIAPIVVSLAVLLIVSLLHLLNSLLLQLELLSPGASDKFQAIYDTRIHPLLDKHTQLSEIFGRMVGTTMVVIIGLSLVLCLRRLLASLLRDELWALITFAVLSTMLFVLGLAIVGYNDIANIAPATSRGSIAALFEATLPAVLVLSHLTSVLVLRRGRYFRAEMQFGTPGFRTFFSRFTLSHGLEGMDFPALKRWSMSQGLRILVVALGVIVAMGSIVTAGGSRAGEDILEIAFVFTSLIGILAGIWRTFIYRKFGLWNILFVIFVVYTYTNPTLPGVLNRSDYYSLLLCMVVYILKSWLFLPGRKVLDMWRPRAVVAAPQMVVRKPDKTALILRSFRDEDDASKIKPSHLELAFAFGGDRVRKTIEEVAIGALSRRYALLTVADPKRDRDAVGAARAILPNEDWREYVVERMVEARVVIVVLGATESLSWEVSEAIRLGIVEKLVFVLPVDFLAKHPLGKVSAALPRLLGVAGEGVESALGGNVRVIGFDAGEAVWRAYSTVGTSERNYSFCIRAAAALADRGYGRQN